MTHGLNDITRTSLTLSADHGRTFANTTESLAEVPASTNEWNLKVMLVDVVRVISGSEHLTLVNVVHVTCLENLGFDKVADATLGHHRDCDSVDNLLDHGWVRHTSNTTLNTDIGRNAFERHDSTCTSFLGDTSLLRVDDVHNNATLQHLSKTRLNTKGA